MYLIQGPYIVVMTPCAHVDYRRTPQGKLTKVWIQNVNEPKWNICDVVDVFDQSELSITTSAKLTTFFNYS